MMVRAPHTTTRGTVLPVDDLPDANAWLRT
jgi:hypothetical protein